MWRFVIGKIEKGPATRPFFSVLLSNKCTLRKCMNSSHLFPLLAITRLDYSIDFWDYSLKLVFAGRNKYVDLSYMYTAQNGSLDSFVLHVYVLDICPYSSFVKVQIKSPIRVWDCGNANHLLLWNILERKNAWNVLQSQ